MKPAHPVIARELLLLSPRIARAGAQVWRGERRGERTRQLARLAEPGWLAGVLGLDPACIASARVEEVHSGTATRSRLLISYAGAPDPPPGPTSLFIKSRPPDFGSALFGILFDLGGNEVNFYRHLRSEIPVKSPEIFHCEGDSRDYLMLLEDLTDEDADFRDLSSKCNLEEATKIFTTLARLHAKFWQSERFHTDLAWVKRLETNRDHRLLNLVRQLSVPITYRKYGDILPAPIREVIPHLMRHYMDLEAQWALEPRTLIHGDAHLGNMYFQGGEACLLDWQVVQYGQGMRDIAYFLINSMSEELRLAHQEALIRHYLATLKDGGVSLDFDTAWRQYRLQSVYAWIAGVVTAPSNFQADAVVIAGLTRASKAVVDLDAISLIREL